MRLLPELTEQEVLSADQHLDEKVRHELLLIKDSFGFRAFGLTINDLIRGYEDMLASESDQTKLVEYAFKRASLVSIVNAFYGSIEESAPQTSDSSQVTLNEE